MDTQIRYYENKLAYEMDSTDLFEAINSGEKIRIIDARSPLGFENEYISGAINIPHREINEDTTRHLDKSSLYVIYCDGIGCNASTHGALKMAKLGFRVKELIGGIDWWKRDGYATEGLNSKNTGIQMQMTCNC